MSADGVGFNEIRQRVDCDVRFIQRWRERFTTDRVAGLSSQPRGRPTKTINARLKAGGLHYSVARLYSRHTGRAPDQGSERQETHILKWTTQRKPRSFHMVDSVPSSIELSPVQREILDLIIQDQASIQGPVQPERVILLWSEGVSESTTAEKLGISEEDVRTLRTSLVGIDGTHCGRREEVAQGIQRSRFTYFPNPKRRTSFRDRIKLFSRRRSSRPRQPRETSRTKRITSCDASAY